MVKVDPPSQQCKKLYAEVHHPTKQQMAQVAKSAFGTASKVDDVERWFTHKRGLELLQSEARLKRRCVLADVERLLRQLRGNLNINGQCAVSNLKRVLMDQGLCSNGPKAELVQRVHNYINIIREAKGLPVDAAEVAHMEEVMQDDVDSDASDIVCAS